ncbi:MAG TPA: zinc ribbon domain-containing protein [Pyrinomonadaceae bacterium]|nr:zinc ribbon domain-containing protein [Pyrinomonadaceae bacterium]
MFCPKCAAPNSEGASFCRSCGANISLVPQALTGQLARPIEEPILVDDRGRRRRRQLTLDIALKNIFLGFAFLVIAIALSRTIGAGWWFWMLLPAFSLTGIGVGQFLRLRERDKSYTPSLPPSPARPTEQLMPPPVPSVTEGTTRHLNTQNTDRQ